MLFLPPVIIAVALTLLPSALSLMMKRRARKLVRLLGRLKQDVEVVADMVAMVVVATNEVNGAALMTRARLLKWESNAFTMCG